MVELTAYVIKKVFLQSPS